MGKLIWHQWARLLAMTAAVCTFSFSLETLYEHTLRSCRYGMG